MTLRAESAIGVMLLALLGPVEIGACSSSKLMQEPSEAGSSGSESGRAGSAASAGRTGAQGPGGSSSEAGAGQHSSSDAGDDGTLGSSFAGNDGSAGAAMGAAGGTGGAGGAGTGGGLLSGGAGSSASASGGAETSGTAGSAANGGRAGASVGGSTSTSSGGTSGVAGGAASCGNGILDAGEVCDTPFGANDCGSDCRAITASTCNDCESAPNACGDLTNCNVATGTASPGCPAAGVARSALCNEVLDCVRDTACAKDAAPIKCYCGTATTTECQAGAGNGKCKLQIQRGLETTDFATITARIGKLTYGGGVAMSRVDCDQTFCADACF